MRKISFIALFLVFILSDISSAQLIKGFGFKFGMTKASQDWDYKSVDSFEPNSRTGVNIGVFAESFGLLGLSAVGEMNYSQKGMLYDVVVTSADGTVIGQETLNNRIDYLSFALFAKYNFNMLLLKPYIFGGPRADFEVTKNIYPGLNDVYDDFNKNILGWSIGAGVEFSLLPVALLAEVRYNADKDNAFKNETLTVKNSTIELQGGIRF